MSTWWRKMFSTKSIRAETSLWPLQSQDVLPRDCWKTAIDGRWQPNTTPRRIYSISNEAAGARAVAWTTSHSGCRASQSLPWRNPPAHCHSPPDRYEWTNSSKEAGTGTPLPPVSRQRWCEVMGRQNIRRVAIVGDSIAWSMVQSLWQLMELSPSGPPSIKPGSKLLKVACGAASPFPFVELQWVSSFYLNASLTVDVMSHADLTLLTAGPWYSPLNAPLRARLPGENSKVVSSNRVWSVFASDLLQLEKLLRHHGLPDAKRRLVWRTSHLGHPNCENHIAPFSRPSEALEGLLQCKTCYESWSWHQLPLYDHAATQVLRAVGAQVFDVQPMTALRPDAHTERSSRTKVGKVVDCLHLALPGVPDWWGSMFLSAIEKCGI